MRISRSVQFLIMAPGLSAILYRTTLMFCVERFVEGRSDWLRSLTDSVSPNCLISLFIYKRRIPIPTVYKKLQTFDVKISLLTKYCSKCVVLLHSVPFLIALNCQLSHGLFFVFLVDITLPHIYLKIEILLEFCDTL